jgi:NitT/TauT family transport system substrate-binding protein
VQSLAELKGKTISVPFASTAHGMLLRAVAAQGWDPLKDVNIIAQPPEVAGSALQAGKIDAHADFVPFAELFPSRGFARKIYDGSQANAPTFHGALVDQAYAKKYPEIVVAYLRASIEANQLLAAEPEKYSELIAKVTGVDAEVNYLFHGPLGVQTRDLSWKPEYRQAVGTAIDTLKLLKKADRGLDLNTFIDDQYIRAAFKASNLDYSVQLASYGQTPLKAVDAASGEAITDFSHVVEIWVRGEPKVRQYASAESAFSALTALKQEGKNIRAVYAQASDSGIKLLADQAWFATDGKGRLSAFLLKGQAQQFATAQGGKVFDFTDATAQAVAVR